MMEVVRHVYSVLLFYSLTCQVYTSTPSIDVLEHRLPELKSIFRSTATHCENHVSERPIWELFVCKDIDITLFL
jgi:hypothetical protein